MMMWLKVLALSLVASSTLALPADTFVVTSTESTKNTNANNKNDEVTVPQIYKMDVTSSVSNRYARTTIASKVKNVAQKAQEAVFAVVLPETAFISGFVMEVDGKNYTAYVEEKEEAKKTYDQAVASGLGAAHVAVSARDSNRFTVSVNVEPETKAAFYLTYEELLQRKDDLYEMVINLHPGQPVKNLNVEVVIAESKPLLNVKAPPLRSGNEIAKENSELDPRATIETTNATSAVIRFSPNLERQKQLAHLLGSEEDEGLAGQFVVQYDVERNHEGGDILVQDGYFVHFFAPSQLKPLAKHIVFVLDTSSSMYNAKIEQLKTAMLRILEQLHEQDLFSLVEFNSYSKVWNLDDTEKSVTVTSTALEAYTLNPNNRHDVDLNGYEFPSAYPANADYIKKAKNAVSTFVATQATDIYTVLRVGLRLVESEKQVKRSDSVNRQPIIMFLTDGDPTVGLTSNDAIMDKITDLNANVRKSALFTLSFGNDADKKFLEKLALRNSGFTRHIYEAADASLQIQNFYKQISSPLLANVTFKYAPSVTSITTVDYPVHFGGSEIVVTGSCKEDATDDFESASIDAVSSQGSVTFHPSVSRPVSSIERLYAYLTIKEQLKKKEISDSEAKELNKKALDLALKYSFVTPVSSLVVVKPNDTNPIDVEKADTREGIRTGGFGMPGLPGPPGIYPLRGDSGGKLNIIPTSADYGPQSYSPSKGSPSFKINPTTHRPVPQGKPDIFKAIPWLENIVNADGFLSLPKLGDYKLGLNETISDNVPCNKTPLNTAGQCKLLNDCKQIHALLTGVNDIVQHFCVLKNEFAGICCPDS